MLKCNISSITASLLAKQKFGLKCYEKNSINVFLQSYITSLNCDDRQYICLNDTEPCDTLKSHSCVMSIRSFTHELIENGIKLTTIIGSGINPITYNWVFDENIFAVVSSIGNELVLRWNNVDSNPPEQVITNIGFTATDASGCSVNRLCQFIISGGGEGINCTTLEDCDTVTDIVIQNQTDVSFDVSFSTGLLTNIRVYDISDNTLYSQYGISSPHTVPLDIYDCARVVLDVTCPNGTIVTYELDLLCSSAIVENINYTQVYDNINDENTHTIYIEWLAGAVGDTFDVKIRNITTSQQIVETGLTGDNITYEILCGTSCAYTLGNQFTGTMIDINPNDEIEVSVRKKCANGVTGLYVVDTFIACSTPYITVTNVDDNSFDVNILNFVAGNTYSISLDGGGLYPYTGIVTATTTITGLLPSTDYDVVVKSSCNNLVSNLVPITTDITTCVVPTITVTNATHNSLDVNITNFTPGQTYSISKDNGATYPITGVITATTTLTGLIPNTAYNIIVKTDCIITPSNIVNISTTNLTIVGRYICQNFGGGNETGITFHLLDSLGNIVTHNNPTLTINWTSAGHPVGGGGFSFGFPLGVDYGNQGSYGTDYTNPIVITGNNKGYINGGVFPYTINTYQNNTASPISVTGRFKSGVLTTVSVAPTTTVDVAIISGGVGLTNLGVTPQNC